MTLTQQRQALQEQFDALNLRADIAQLETVLRHHDQQQNLIEAWGDYIDPMDSLRSDPEFFATPGAGHVSRGDDKRFGDNAPIFNEEQRLSFIRGAGEWIGQTDATAIGALETLASYVVGTGFVWQAEGDDEKAVMFVQRIVDEFLDRSNWLGDLDRELFKRTRRSGERFVRLHQLQGGISEVEVCEPSWIMTPANAGQVAYHYGLDPRYDWKYGVCTDAGRATKVHGYAVFRHGDPEDFEFVPVEDMSHVKINVDRNVKRGVTDFYAVEGWISGASKLLNRTIEGGAIQASIALVREWNPKASDANIQSAAGGLVKYQSKLANPSAAAGYSNIPTERFYSGKVVDVRGGKYSPGPMGGSNAPTYIDIVQAGLRKAASRWSMPEFMFTGDASNANYSSSLVSESPFVKFCEYLQKQTERDDASVFWRVVKHAAESGRTGGYSYDDLKQAVMLSAAKPDIATRDRLQDHTIRKELNAAGILSRETWAQETDHDYELERQKIEQEPPVATADPTQAAAFGAALESVTTTDEARAILESMA